MSNPVRCIHCGSYATEWNSELNGYFCRCCEHLTEVILETKQNN